VRKEKVSCQEHRRKFLFSSIFLSPLIVCGCKGVLAQALSSQGTGPSEIDTFQNDAGMSYGQVFNFAFRSWFIRYMKGLEAELGKDRFLRMLEDVGSKIYADSTRSRFRDIQDKNVDALITNFWEPMVNSRLWSNAMTIDIVKKAGSSGVVKMTACLVAKTFREAEASDIGYAAICHADFAVAQAFNPKIELIRNTCLMKGDDRCYFEYTLRV
jgi:hypothetical protein